MSADMDMSVMSGARACAAFADVAKGATARPRVTHTAKIRFKGRRKSMTYHFTATQL